MAQEIRRTVNDTDAFEDSLYGVHEKNINSSNWSSFLKTGHTENGIPYKLYLKRSYPWNIWHAELRIQFPSGTPIPNTRKISEHTLLGYENTIEPIIEKQLGEEALKLWGSINQTNREVTKTYKASVKAYRKLRGKI